MQDQSFPAPKTIAKGRGATLNGAGRFESRDSEWFDDGWGEDEAVERAAKRPKTVIHIETARSIISHNESPDIRFEQSINPYRGCEHGCIYCYARPTHSYLNLSPGMDSRRKFLPSETPQNCCVKRSANGATNPPPSTSAPIPIPTSR